MQGNFVKKPFNHLTVIIIVIKTVYLYTEIEFFSINEIANNKNNLVIFLNRL